MTQNTEQIPARWYAVSRTGVATLCVDKNDARESAVQFDHDWPDAAPHVAVLLAPAAQGDALDRECWAIGRAINRAAADLPKFWEISIALECDAGTVHLTNPDGEETMIEGGGEPFSEQINEAIDAALKENGNG
ncbi:hypothetical protein [Kerstersia gyiorum]|nr:hypothetical protein [Kerstersia gyiorum]